MNQYTIRKLLFLIFPLFCLSSCHPKLDYTIKGRWEVTNFRAEIENVPTKLIEHAELIALSTKYEFRDDGRFIMTIFGNSVDSIGREYRGKAEIDSRNMQITLHTDSVLLESEDNWKVIEQNDNTAFMFKTIEFKAEKVSYYIMDLVQKEETGLIFYTIERIE